MVRILHRNSIFAEALFGEASSRKANVLELSGDARAETSADKATKARPQHYFKKAPAQVRWSELCTSSMGMT